MSVVVQSVTAEDRIEHYACCPVTRQFLSTPVPKGPGVNDVAGGTDIFFGVKRGMSDDQRLHVAKAIYAVGKVLVQAMRIEWNKA